MVCVPVENLPNVYDLSEPVYVSTFYDVYKRNAIG
jgi:hypothetical protein